jgi:hypothetical protein
MLSQISLPGVMTGRHVGVIEASATQSVRPTEHAPLSPVSHALPPPMQLMPLT